MTTDRRIYWQMVAGEGRTLVAPSYVIWAREATYPVPDHARLTAETVDLTKLDYLGVHH